jgi:hypothetical protein
MLSALPILQPGSWVSGYNTVNLTSTAADVPLVPAVSSSHFDTQALCLVRAINQRYNRPWHARQIVWCTSQLPSTSGSVCPLQQKRVGRISITNPWGPRHVLLVSLQKRVILSRLVHACIDSSPNGTFPCGSAVLNPFQPPLYKVQQHESYHDESQIL